MVKMRRMNAYPIRLLLIAGLLNGLLITTPLSAQDDRVVTEEEPVDLYQVEVLVFRHVDQSRTTAEIPRLVEPEIDDLLDQQLARLSADDAIAPHSSANDEPDEPFWQPAPAESLLMQKDAARLKKLDAYDLITHLAWIQPAEDVAVAKTIATAELDADPQLSGTVKLYRKRYLHLAVDLTLGKPAGGSDASGFSQFLPVARVQPAIMDSRRMRLGRTVYFDQPEFGVLATVSRLQPADN